MTTCWHRFWPQNLIYPSKIWFGTIPMEENYMRNHLLILPGLQNIDLYVFFPTTFVLRVSFSPVPGCVVAWCWFGGFLCFPHMYSHVETTVSASAHMCSQVVFHARLYGWPCSTCADMLKPQHFLPVLTRVRVHSHVHTCRNKAFQAESFPHMCSHVDCA